MNLFIRNNPVRVAAFVSYATGGWKIYSFTAGTDTVTI